MGVDSLRGVVMAGGVGTRFGRRVEKAMLEVGGISLLRRAVAALDLKEIDSVAVTVTDNTPITATAAQELGIGVIKTAGKGYHSDTLEVLGIDDRFVSLNVDVPFATSEHVRLLMKRARSRSAAAVVPARLSTFRTDTDSLLDGTDGEKMVWAGLNIVSDDPETGLVVIPDDVLCINVNDDLDLDYANRVAIERGI